MRLQKGPFYTTVLGRPIDALRLLTRLGAYNIYNALTKTGGGDAACIDLDAVRRTTALVPLPVA